MDLVANHQLFIDFVRNRDTFSAGTLLSERCHMLIDGREIEGPEKVFLMPPACQWGHCFFCCCDFGDARRVCWLLSRIIPLLCSIICLLSIIKILHVLLRFVKKIVTEYVCRLLCVSPLRPAP